MCLCLYNNLNPKILAQMLGHLAQRYMVTQNQASISSYTNLLSSYGGLERMGGRNITGIESWKRVDDLDEDVEGVEGPGDGDVSLAEK